MTEQELFELAAESAKRKLIDQNNLEIERGGSGIFGKILHNENQRKINERNKNRPRPKKIYEQMISKNIKHRKLKEELVIIAKTGTEPIILELLHKLGLPDVIEKFDSDMNVVIEFENPDNA